MYKKLYFLIVSLIFTIISFTACSGGDGSEENTSSGEFHNASDNVPIFQELIQNDFSVDIGNSNVVIKNIDVPIVSYANVFENSILEECLDDCIRIDYNVDYSLRDLHLYLTSSKASTIIDTLEKNSFEKTKDYYENITVFVSAKKRGLFLISEGIDYSLVGFINLEKEKALSISDKLQTTFLELVNSSYVDNNKLSINDYFKGITVCGLNFSSDCALDLWNQEFLRVSCRKNPDTSLYLLADSDNSLSSFVFSYLGELNGVTFNYCLVEDGTYGISMINGDHSYNFYYFSKEKPTIGDIKDYFNYE